MPNVIRERLHDLMLDAVFVVDEQGYVQDVSAGCEGIFGYTQQELLGRRLIELVLPDDHERTREEAGRVMSGEPRVGFENRYRHKDGRIVHVMWSARWLEAERLRVGVARDVTALRQAGAPAASAPAVPRLAPNERRVLELLLTEATEKQIAERLGLAPSTVHSYVTGIFRKFNVRGRAGLMSLWLSQRPALGALPAGPAPAPAPASGTAGPAPAGKAGNGAATAATSRAAAGTPGAAAGLSGTPGPASDTPGTASAPASPGGRRTPLPS